jgi:cell division protein ZipA
MDNMRLILLLIGIVIILGVYFVTRLQGRRPAAPQHRRRPPVSSLDEARPAGDPLDAVESDDSVDAELERLGQLIAEEAPPAAPTPVVEAPAEKPEPARCDKVFTLFVLAPAGVPFRGPVLLGGLAAAKLEFGDMQIFHRAELVNGQEKVLFSVVNIREPGTFDLSAMEHFTTDGLALFLQIPGAVDAVRAFDAMVESARILADALDGTVCDASRSVMTNQTIGHMRDEVISCQLQQRVANKAS